MLKTSFPTGDALPRPPTPRAKRKRGKVGRSYAKLGTATTRDARGVRSPGFFPTPITWGNTPVARNILAHGGERIAMAGKATRVEFPLPWSPGAGTIVEGAPPVTPSRTIGAGVGAPIALDPCSDPVTRFLDDGDNAARNARRASLPAASGIERMTPVFARNADGRFHFRICRIAELLFGQLNAPFDIADAGQVVVQLFAITTAQFVLQAAGIVEHKVENRALLLLAELIIRFAFRR
jgi:hypothetical protein